MAYCLSCTHTERYCHVDARPYGFPASCKGKNCQLIAYRPIYTPLWGCPSFRQRHDTILAVHNVHMDEVYAQAERERRSYRSVAQAMKRYYQQEHIEIKIFLAAVEEAESPIARVHGVRRGKYHRDSDEVGQ